MTLMGKTALVTGASRGIGKAIQRHLVAKVALNRAAGQGRVPATSGP